MRIALLGVLAALACMAETKFYVDQRGDYANGKSFGQAGVYEFLTTRVVTDAGEGKAEVLKPREPKLGNGTLVVEVNGKGKLAPPESTLSTGETIVRLTWPNAGTLQAGVAEIVDFLKFRGGPMLLGDQRAFLKRAYVVDNGKWVSEFSMSAKNKDQKGRPLFEGAIRGPGAKTFDGSKPEPFTN